MNTTRLGRWLLPFVGLMVLGACGTTKMGQCEPPREHLEWFFIIDRGPTGSLTKCVFCDPTVSAAETPDWIRANAGEDYRDADDEQLEGKMACFYVYGPGAHDTRESCSALACSENPTVNDPVSADHQAGRAIRGARNAN
jgi:hypothetical protein